MIAVDTEGTARLVGGSVHVGLRKRWTKQRRALLVALAVDGFDRQTLALALDVSPHAVSCEMSRLGLTIKSLQEADFT